MKLIGHKGDYQVYFDAVRQEYEVRYKGKVLINGRSRFRDVRSYLE